MKILEISKKDLKSNIDIIKKIVSEESPNTKIYAVVKGNGVGLGIIEISKFLIENGITSLAVATYEEAIKLRNAEIKEEILMLSPTPDRNELKLLVENDITLTIGSKEEFETLKEILKELKKENYKVHIKIDTGFGRYGFLYSDIKTILNVFKEAENVRIEGMFTHCSKPTDEKWTNTQFERFMEVVEKIKENGYETPILHIASSTVFLKYPKMRLNAVRIGSLFQGRTLVKNTGLIKIGNFKTTISEIKTVPKGYNISYGNTYKTKRESKLATIPVGYMDGCNKEVKREDYSLKNNIVSILMEVKKLFTNNNVKVKINGKYYNRIGRMGMYHSIIDITDSDNIKVGDEVIIEVKPLQTNDEIRREYI